MSKYSDVEFAPEGADQLRSSVYSASTGSPDQAAAAARLARDRGLTPDMVQRNLLQVQRAATVDRIDSDTQAAPTLRNRYGDVQFASVAHDDSGPLAKVESVLRNLGGAAKAGVFGASAGAAGAARAGLELVAPALDLLEPVTAIGGNPIRRLAEGFAMRGADAQAIADAAAPKAQGWASGGFYSGIQSLTQNALMLPMAFAPGGQAAVLTGMTAQAGGQEFNKARDKGGKSTVEAIPYAASQAAIEYATERLPLLRLVGDVKAGTPFFQTLLRQVGAEVPGEQVATVLQDLNEWAVLNPQKPFADYLAERPSAAAQTLVATIVAAGGNVTVAKAANAVAERMQGAQQATDSAAQLQQLVQAADTSALKKRDPQTFAEFVDQVQPDGVVYVSPEHLAGVDLSAVPQVAAQAAEAQAAGGDVAIKLSDLVAHLPAEQLLPNLRTQPESSTLAEAQSLDAPAKLAAEVLNWDDQPGTGAMLRQPVEGMDAGGWEAYQAAAAESAQAAIEQRDARSLRDMQWLGNRVDEASRQLHREAKAARDGIAEQALAEVLAQPVYQAQRYLRTAEGKATPADVVAEMFGYSSGDAMQRAIAEAPPSAEVVEGLVDQRMLEQHPDIADQIGQRRSAEAMVADRARERFLATEAAALAEAVGNRVLLAGEARMYAEGSIARRTVREVRPAQFSASADRAGRAADLAFRKGDTALAAKYKQSQVLQHALATEARHTKDEIERALRSFVQMRKSSQDRDGHLENVARAILAQFGLGQADKSAADYMAQVQRYDPELHADLVHLLDDLPAPVADHKNLTVADFREIRDRVQAIWTLARTTRQIEIEGQQVEIDAAATLLAERLGGEPKAKRDELVGRNEGLDLRMRLAGIRAALRRVEHWADARDRGDPRGPFRRCVWNPVSEAVTRYRESKAKHVGEFLRLLKTIEPTLKPGKIDANKELGTTFADRSALLHALLHTGNESNKRKLLLGYGWASENADGSLDTSRWDAFLRRMHEEGKLTKADWDFVQKTWDLLEQMKPAAQKAHKRMFGRYFDEITAEPVETPFGQFRGGYVPAITDSLKVTESRQHGAMDDMLASQGSPMFPSVGRGFTKARIEDYTRPLALDLRLLPAHIDKAARFAELGPALREVARLVARNRTFRGAMDDVDSTAIEGLLVPWLKRTAAQTLTAPPEGWAGRAVGNIASTVRNRTGLVMMAGNVVNTLQQVTGASVAALRVKPSHLAAGMLQYLRSPVKTGEAINELSPWMKQRSEGGAHDLERQIESLTTNPGALKRVGDWGEKYGYVLQQGAQNLLDRTVWLGAFRQAEERGATDADAVRQADAAVRMTQSSFAPEDSAAVEHQKAFVRLFLQFFSFFSAQSNLLATEGVNAERNVARLAMVYALGFAVPAMVADLIAKSVRGEIDWDDEDELSEDMLQILFASQARYAMGMLPVAGQVGNAALGQFTPERFDDRIGASPTYSAVESTLRAPKSIYGAAAEDANPRAAVRDGLTAAALLLGLPTGWLVRPLGYLADDERGDEVTVRGLVTGKDEGR